MSDDDWPDEPTPAESPAAKRSAPPGPRRTSPGGVSELEGEEGIKRVWYYDFARYETGGMGHRWVSGDPPFVEGGAIAQAQIDAWAANDLRIAESAVNAFVLGNIGQNMFDALVSLCFNIGTAAERASSVLRLLNSGGYLAAADHFRDWNKVVDRATGKLVVSPILTARRERERAIFLRDVSTLDDGP